MYLPVKRDTQVYVGASIHVPTLSDVCASLGCGTYTKPHVTLIPPTPIYAAELPFLLSRARTLCTVTSAFRLHVSGFDDFRPVSDVLFATVREGYDNCVNLAHLLAFGPLNVPQRFDYVPHVTLAQGAQVDEARRRLEGVEGLDVDCEVQVNHIQVDLLDEVGACTRSTTLPLS